MKPDFTEVSSDKEDEKRFGFTEVSAEWKPRFKGTMMDSYRRNMSGGYSAVHTVYSPSMNRQLNAEWERKHPELAKKLAARKKKYEKDHPNFTEVSAEWKPRHRGTMMDSYGRTMSG